MGMNVHKGMARLARVVAITYAVVAVLWVAGTTYGAFDGYRASLKTYPIHIEGIERDVRVRVHDEGELTLRMQQFCHSQPGGNCSGKGAPPNLMEIDPPVMAWLRYIFSATWPAVLGWTVAYAVMWVFFRAARWVLRGFLDPSENPA